MARALGCTQANASYHLRLLARAGQVEVAEQVVVRGGRATRYRYVVGDERDIAASPHSPQDHRLFSAALAEELQRRTAMRDTAHAGPSTDAELWVQAKAWEAFCAAVVAASRELHVRAEPPGSARLGPHEYDDLVVSHGR